MHSYLCGWFAFFLLYIRTTSVHPVYLNTCGRNRCESHHLHCGYKTISPCCCIFVTRYHCFSFMHRQLYSIKEDHTSQACESHLMSGRFQQTFERIDCGWGETEGEVTSSIIQQIHKYETECWSQNRTVRWERHKGEIEEWISLELIDAHCCRKDWLLLKLLRALGSSFALQSLLIPRRHICTSIRVCSSCRDIIIHAGVTSQPYHKPRASPCKIRHNIPVFSRCVSRRERVSWWGWGGRMGCYARCVSIMTSELAQDCRREGWGGEKKEGSLVNRCRAAFVYSAYIFCMDLLPFLTFAMSNCNRRSSPRRSGFL